MRRGQDDAFRRGENLQKPGVGYRLVDVLDANGKLVITRKNTIAKAVEIDPEAAEWIRRGAEMIAYEGRSAMDVARLFNEHKVGGKQTWSDSRIRTHYAIDRLVGLAGARHRGRGRAGHSPPAPHREAAAADTAALQEERGIPARKTQAAGCATAVGACGARRCVRHRLPAPRRRPG